MSRLFAAAAETSGDRLLAGVVAALRAREPSTRIRGFAGPASVAAGLEPAGDGSDLGVVGVQEALAVVGRAARLRWDAARELRAGPWGACLTVDAPSALLPVARSARAAGVPALHLVAPQVWAWRPDRVRAVARDVDALLCLLPFEPAWFAGHVRAVFVGHPAAAIAPRPVPPPGRPTVALCPGSRPGEVASLWPTLVAVAARVRRRWPGAGFLVPVAPGRRVPVAQVPGAVAVDGLAACAGADAAVVASGTATIELAALDVPMVAVYRVHPLTAAVARRWLRVPHVALPNVLAGRALVPEHLQDLDPDAIAADVAALVGRRGQVPRSVIAALDGPAAIDRITDEVGAWLGAPACQGSAST